MACVLAPWIKTAKRKSLKEDLAGGSPQAVRLGVNSWRLEEKKGCVKERRGGLHNTRARLPLTPCLARTGRFLHLQRSKVWSSEKTPRAAGAGVGVGCQREMESEHECVFFLIENQTGKVGRKLIRFGCPGRVSHCSALLVCFPLTWSYVSLFG